MHPSSSISHVLNCRLSRALSSQLYSQSTGHVLTCLLFNFTKHIEERRLHSVAVKGMFPRNGIKERKKKNQSGYTHNHTNKDTKLEPVM